MAANTTIITDILKECLCSYYDEKAISQEFRFNMTKQSGSSACDLTWTKPPKVAIPPSTMHCSSKQTVGPPQPEAECEVCAKQYLTTTTTTTTTAATTTTVTSFLSTSIAGGAGQGGDDDKAGAGKGATVAAAVILVLLALIALAVIGGLYYRKKKRAAQDQPKKNTGDDDGKPGPLFGSLRASELDTLHDLSEQRTETEAQRKACIEAGCGGGKHYCPQPAKSPKPREPTTETLVNNAPSLALQTAKGSTMTTSTKTVGDTTKSTGKDITLDTPDRYGKGPKGSPMSKSSTSKDSKRSPS